MPPLKSLCPPKATSHYEEQAEAGVLAEPVSPHFAGSECRGAYIETAVFVYVPGPVSK